MQAKDQSPMTERCSREPTIGELRDMDREEWPAWFDRDEWPRDASVCRPSDHTFNRVNEYGRALDFPMIAEAIETGRLIPGRNRCACYAIEREGLSHFVVVGTDDANRDEYRVVTAWAWIDDHAAALREGWSPRLLDTVKKVNNNEPIEGCYGNLQ